MKALKKAPISPSRLAVKKSLGTLEKVLVLIENEKQYGAVIQQIDAAIGLAQAAKRSLMVEHLGRVVKESKNQKKLVQDLQKLYAFAAK